MEIQYCASLHYILQEDGRPVTLTLNSMCLRLWPQSILMIHRSQQRDGCVWRSRQLGGARASQHVRWAGLKAAYAAVSGTK